MTEIEEFTSVIGLQLEVTIEMGDEEGEIKELCYLPILATQHNESPHVDFEKQRYRKLLE
jgi:hypothetical protein